MAQGTISSLRLFEDFLFGDLDAVEVAVADTTPERIGLVTVGGDDTALTLAPTVDEPGGVLSIDVTDDTTDEGFAVYSAPFRPADGTVSLEVRCKTNDISGTNFFVGFMESFTPGDPDQGMPFTMATTAITVVNLGVTAGIFAKENCVIAGIDIARWAFNALDERIELRSLSNDGDSIKKGKKIASLKGSVRNILTGERVALNFLGQLSGIATLTHRFVEKVKGTKAEILDTRKTIPGMREAAKYAVRMGKGVNHRMGLWDGILIKDNHLNVMRDKGYTTRINAIKDAIKRAKTRGYKNVEIEVEDLKEFKEALAIGADIIMLDNMKVEDIRKATRLRAKSDKKQKTKTILEVSGGVSLENCRRIANTGVDRISIGALTHSAPSIDFSLEICK